VMKAPSAFPTSNSGTIMAGAAGGDTNKVVGRSLR